jgi:hypothetical protein
VKRHSKAVLAACLVALAVATGSLAGGEALHVGLTTTGGGAALDVGQAVHLTATAKLPRGGHLVVQAFPDSGAAAKIKDCLRSPCTAAYTSSEEQQVAFQASVTVRKLGKTTTLGRSARTSVFWSEPAPPPPPPPPPPVAVPGHYEGFTQDHEVFAFDVSADGTRISGLHTGQINESCNPPDYYLYGGGFTGIFGPIAQNGTFSYSFNFSTTVGPNPATSQLKLSGTISGGTASGTIREDIAFTNAGTGYSCTNGDQTWAATKV